MLQIPTCLAFQNQDKRRPLAFAGRGLKVLQRGFSLVEIAVVLVIAALALGAGMALLNAKFTQTKIDITKARAEFIRIALTNYVGQYYRLPCPADPQIVVQVPRNKDFHRAMPDTGMPCTSTVSSFLNIDVSPSLPLGVSRGTVPCATLGIADEACTDGYGNRFTYFVDNRAVILKLDTVSGMRGSMTIHKMTPPAAATPVIGAVLPGNQINVCSSVANDNSCNLAAVVMIISHGANNGGAYPPGTSTPHVSTFPNISPYETANTDNNIQFIQNEYVERGDYSFDDVVVPLVPRDLISTLNQTGIIKDTNVFMNERFELIKLALLRHAYANASPVSPSRTLQLAAEGGGTAPYPFTVTQIPSPLPCSVTPATTQLLPLATTIPALHAAGGILNDAWGRAIRYIRVENTVTNTSTCTVPFVLLSYGPNGVPNGTAGTVDDDDVRYITSTDITVFVSKYGSWN